MGHIALEFAAICHGQNKDQVDWYGISKYQKLSADFIREFKDRVDWRCISEHQKLSEDFIKEFCSELFMRSIENSWHYISDADKKAAVQSTDLYECHEDYFIAYKGIRSDRYSSFNFQYQYLPGETYEIHADHSDTENSFGFSVWNEENARNYRSEKIVTCKVYYLCKHSVINVFNQVYQKKQKYP